MVKLYVSSTNLSPSPQAAVRNLLLGSWSWKSCGAIGGLLGGLSAPVFASLFTMVSWFIDPAWHGFHLRTAATVMFALTIPLLTLGAHCLDLLEKEKDLARSRRRLDGRREAGIV